MKKKSKKIPFEFGNPEDNIYVTVERDGKKESYQVMNGILSINLGSKSGKGGFMKGGPSEIMTHITSTLNNLIQNLLISGEESGQKAEVLEFTETMIKEFENILKSMKENLRISADTGVKFDLLMAKSIAEIAMGKVKKSLFIKPEAKEELDGMEQQLKDMQKIVDLMSKIKKHLEEEE